MPHDPSSDVDVVYTFHDVNEPGRFEPLRAIQKKLGLPEQAEYSVGSRVLAGSEEIKYSIRSIDQNVTYNKLYIVTNSDIPDYFDKNLVNIVRHEDIFLNPQEDLPTYNSVAIESNLHRIPGLSEEFIYMCDDCYLLAPCEKSKFFPKGGVSVFVDERMELDENDLLVGMRDIPHDWSMVNVARMVSEKLPEAMPRYKAAHQLTPMKKSVLQKAEKTLFNEAFAKNSRIQIRNNERYSLMLMHMIMALSEGVGKERLFMPGESLFADLTDDDEFCQMVFNNVYQFRPALFCLNIGYSDENQAMRNSHFNFLQALLPKPSRFEKV